MNRLKTAIQEYVTDNQYFNVSFGILVVIMLTLPFTTFLMWPAAIGLLISAVLENNWREKIIYFKENHGIPYGIILLLIYLIPLIGFFYSENKFWAWGQIECYAWFLMAPLTILTISDKYLSYKHLSLLAKLYVASVFAGVIFLFARGISLSIIHNDTIYLYYVHFSVIRHPTFAAIFTSFAFFLCLDFLLKNHHRVSTAQTVLLFAVELILALGIFCLYSRAGILIFFFLLAVWMVYFLINYGNQWKKIVLLVAVTVATFSILMSSGVLPVNRFAKTKYSVDEKSAKDKSKSELRASFWILTLDCIKESLPFGVGTGDAQDEIKAKAIEKGYKNIAIAKHHHPHNQYLMALLTNGIPGIVILLLYMMVPFVLAVKYKNIHLLTLFLLLSMNCLLETVFDLHAGVEFFAIMIPIFMLMTKYPPNEI